MPSRTDSARAKGFTLLEVMLVIILLSVLAMLGLFGNHALYRRQGLAFETETLAVLLLRARDYSLSGMEGAPYRVCMEKDSYVLYGAIGIPEVTRRGKTVAVEGVPTCEEGGVAFSPYSATTSGASITLREGERTAAIEVNREGMLTW